LKNNSITQFHNHTIYTISIF